MLVHCVAEMQSETVIIGCGNPSGDIEIMSYVLHINGWPGSGKRTIGKIIAERLGARLLDNHVMLNPAEALFERGDPLHASLRNAVREVTLDHAERLAPSVSIILTDALVDDPDDTALFERFRHLARSRNACLVAIVLEIAQDENARRLVSPGRSDSLKLTRVDVLSAMRSQYRLLRPSDVEIIELDVTDLSAAEAATQILNLLEHLDLDPEAQDVSVPAGPK